MEVRKIITYHSFLRRLPFTSFDKEARMAILKLNDSFSEPFNKAQERLKAVNERVFNTEELKKRFQELSNLRNEYREATRERGNEIEELIKISYADIVELEKETIPLTEEILSEDVKVSIVRIPVESFVDGIVKENIKFTAADIEYFSPILAKLK